MHHLRSSRSDGWPWFRSDDDVYVLTLYAAIDLCILWLVRRRVAMSTSSRPARSRLKPRAAAFASSMAARALDSWARSPMPRSRPAVQSSASFLAR